MDGKWLYHPDPGTGAGAYKISGGANGGFLDWWGNNGTYVGLGLALLSLVAVVASVTASVVIMLAVFSIFVAIMNMMVIELQTMESGCPQGIATMGISLESLALVVSFMGAPGVALGTWLSFLSGGAISGVAGSKVCRSI